MKKSTMVLGALVSGVLAFSSQSFADSGWYLSGKVGKTSGEADFDFSEIDDSATSYGLAGGFRFSDNFSLQLGLTEYSEFSEEYSDIDPGFYYEVGSFGGEVEAMSLVAIGSIPVSDSFSLFGKLGLASWDVDFEDEYTYTITGLGTFSESYSESDSGTDVVYGLGANWNLSDFFGLSFEYEILGFDAEIDDVDADVDMKTMSLGAVFSF